MARIIKFRCWYGGTMITVGDIQFMMGGTYIVNDELPIPPEHLMQWTGLQDKTGKDIYEGDFIKGGFDRVMKVEWILDYGSFGLTTEHWAYIHYFGEAVDAGHCEVVGNIYETPNLIKHGN